MGYDPITLKSSAWSIEKAKRGVVFWRKRVFGGLGVRMVEYTPGSSRGRLVRQGADPVPYRGRARAPSCEMNGFFMLRLGISYQAADNAEF